MKPNLKFRVFDDKVGRFLYFDLFSAFGMVPEDLKEKVEQFSGLYDDKQHEIYEGDIVDTDTPFHHNQIIDQIIFTDGSFQLKEMGYAVFDLDSLKIIGNIHQNSSLLE